MIPGSDQERLVVRELRERLDEVADELYYVELPVYVWNHDCTLFVGGREEPCAHLPYTARLEREIGPGEIVYIDGEVDRLPENLDLKGKVVFVQYPRSYLNLRLLVYELAFRRPELVVLISGDYLKFDVVLASPGISDLPSLPLPICVISTSVSVAKKALERGFEIRARSRISHGRGIILVARLNGVGENEVHIVTHHDVLLGDFESTPSSVLDKILKRLKELNMRPNTVAISYTSRELGDYMFTEYHFGWGERYFLSLAESKGLLDQVLYAIAIGPVHSEQGIMAHAHPVFSAVDLGDGTLAGMDYNLAFMEGEIYSRHGVPSVTLTTLPRTWSVHNTNTRFSIGGNLADKLVELVLDVLCKSHPSDDWFNIARKATYNLLGEISLEGRLAYSRLLDASSKYGPRKGLRELTRSIHGVIGIACNDPMFTKVFSGLGVPLSQFVLGEIASILEHCHGEVIVSSRDFTITLMSSRDHIIQYLNSYTEYWLKRLDALVEQLTLKVESIEKR